MKLQSLLAVTGALLLLVAACAQKNASSSSQTPSLVITTPSFDPFRSPPTTFPYKARTPLDLEGRVEVWYNFSLKIGKYNYIYWTMVKNVSGHSFKITEYRDSLILRDAAGNVIRVEQGGTDKDIGEIKPGSSRFLHTVGDTGPAQQYKNLMTIEVVIDYMAIEYE